MKKAALESGIFVWSERDLILFKPRAKKVCALSIANLNSPKLPAISIPVALANQPASGLFDVDRLGRVINRRRRSRTRPQGAAEQRPADKAPHDASGGLPILRSLRHRRQKRALRPRTGH